MQLLHMLEWILEGTLGTLAVLALPMLFYFLASEHERRMDMKNQQEPSIRNLLTNHLIEKVIERSK